MFDERKLQFFCDEESLRKINDKMGGDFGENIYD